MPWECVLGETSSNVYCRHIRTDFEGICDYILRGDGNFDNLMSQNSLFLPIITFETIQAGFSDIILRDISWNISWNIGKEVMINSIFKENFPFEFLDFF